MSFLVVKPERQCPPPKQVSLDKNRWDSSVLSDEKGNLSINQYPFMTLNHAMLGDAKHIHIPNKKDNNEFIFSSLDSP